jgi:hypothetical protein
VIKAWEEEGIGTVPHHGVNIIPPYPNKLAAVPAPAYVWIDGSRIRGALVDFDASGFVDVRFCPECGNRTDDIKATYDRQNSKRWPFAFIPGSWQGNKIFTTDISPTKFFCTDGVLRCATKHKLTNFRFVRAEDGKATDSRGIKYL